MHEVSIDRIESGECHKTVGVRDIEGGYKEWSHVIELRVTGWPTEAQVASGVGTTVCGW